jgi:hypothetical protein
MSRAMAGVGSGIGVFLGAVSSVYLSETFRMRRDQADYAVLLGTVLGGALGAAVGAGTDCAAPGTVGELPRLPRFP